MCVYTCHCVNLSTLYGLIYVLLLLLVCTDVVIQLFFKLFFFEFESGNADLQKRQVSNYLYNSQREVNHNI